MGKTNRLMMIREERLSYNSLPYPMLFFDSFRLKNCRLLSPGAHLSAEWSNWMTARYCVDI